MIFVQKFKKVALLCLTLILSNPLYLQASNSDNSNIDVDMSPNTRLALAFDGGGIRGIFALFIMNEIQKGLDFPFIKAFDIAFGTSTGGISVAALTHPDEKDPSHPKYSVGKVLEIYSQYGQDIFPPAKWGWFSSFYNVFGAKYSAQGLKNVAQEYFGDGLLSHSIIPIGVVTNNISPNKPYIFYSDPFYKEAEEKEQDWYTKDVIMATSAAPTYFPVACISPVICENGVPRASRQKYSFVDGGVSGQNNPAVAAYAGLCNHIDFDVRKDFKQESDVYRDTLSTLAQSNVRVISFGTGYVENSESLDKMENAGLMKWATSIINLTLNMPSQSNDNLMKTFLPSYLNNEGNKIHRHYRFNSIIPTSLEAMDDASAKNLHALEQEAQKFINQNQDKIEQARAILRTRYAFKQEQERKNQQNLISKNLYKAGEKENHEDHLGHKYAFELNRLNTTKASATRFFNPKIQDVQDQG